MSTACFLGRSAGEDPGKSACTASAAVFPMRCCRCSPIHRGAPLPLSLILRTATDYVVKPAGLSDEAAWVLNAVDAKAVQAHTDTIPPVRRRQM